MNTTNTTTTPAAKEPAMKISRTRLHALLTTCKRRGLHKDVDGYALTGLHTSPEKVQGQLHRLGLVAYKRNGSFKGVYIPTDAGLATIAAALEA